MVIFKDSRAGVSKGCGLVTMASREAAEAAMAAIDGKLQMQVPPCLATRPLATGRQQCQLMAHRMGSMVRCLIIVAGVGHHQLKEAGLHCSLHS